MTQKVWKRCISGLLSLVMLMTMIVVPSFAAENTSIAIKDDAITTDTTRITVDITEKPDSGILRVIQMDAGARYDSNKLNTYTSLSFSVLTALKNGENALSLTGKPTVGKQVMAVLRDASGSEAIMDYCSAPITVTAPQAATTVEITAPVKSDAASVTVTVTGEIPTGAVLMLKSYDAGTTTFATSGGTWKKSLLSVANGANHMEVSGLAAGEKLVAFLTDNGTLVAQSAPVTIEAASTSTKTPEEILANCSVKLMDGDDERTSKFKLDSTSADVAVQLDDSVTNGCYLTVFGYAGNTAFDSDATYNVRLWSGKVQNGQRYTCTFSDTARKSLKIGYKIIACLNVPVGEDNYRSVVSQAIEVVDENGEGFKDYTYPDATIDETKLTSGATSLHISLTGDERLFEAARKGQTAISVVVREYPNGDTIDLDEGKDQRTLYSEQLSVTKAFSGKEVALNQPLRAGYRVRAITYWTQNQDIFLPKGNDYEKSFGRPDDSILVSAADSVTAAITAPVTANDKSVTVMLTGSVPDSALILLKSYDAGVTAFKTNEGTTNGSLFGAKAGTNTVEPTFKSLESGKQLVAFVLSAGSPVAQSDPVTVSTGQDFAVTLAAPFTAGDTSVTFNISKLNSALENNINIAALCKVVNGKADTNNPVARKYGQEPGAITFTDLAADAFSAGDNFCLALTYNNGDSTFTSDTFTVAAPVGENDLTLSETKFTTDSTSATVVIKGCDSFKGGHIILTTGSAASNGDGDTRTRLGSQSFTGEGTYHFTFDHSLLKANNTIQAYLYLLDATDRTYYKYSNAVTIQSNGVITVEPNIELVTNHITTDRTDLWAKAEFDKSLTGILKLYTFTGDTFSEDTATEIYSGTAALSQSSQRVTFGAGKLHAGDKLIGKLILSNGTTALSPVRTIEAAPEKDKPIAYILDSKLTAGMTRIKANLMFDSSLTADYAVYQFEGKELNTATATRLASGTLYKSATNQGIYVGIGKFKVGAKVQIVLTDSGNNTIQSNILTVEPSPDWGTPYAAFDVSAVKADATEIPVTIDYSNEYLSLGDQFYCDVSIYKCSSKYTDDNIKNDEIWEDYNNVTLVAKANTRTGDSTNGKLVLPVRNGVALTAGDKLFIKLRLPHTEWEDEEVDYVSASVPIIDAGEDIPYYKVVLWNLSEDTSRGARLRTILERLGIPFKEITYKHLNETVGYLAGLDGYEAAKTPYTGDNFTSEFMLLCNLPESMLDAFLDAMQNDGLRIDHKAVVTEYNREYEFHELISDIGEEHNVFQALLALNSMIEKSDALSETDYGTHERWQAFQSALADATALIRSEEPSYEDLTAKYEALKAEYLAVTDMTELTGKAVIDIRREDNGSYTLTASVKDSNENVNYTYTWKNGSIGATLTGIPADRLTSCIVTVTAENKLGELTAQLSVPEAPKADTSVTASTIKVNWPAIGAADNRPAAEKYVGSLYKDNKLVKTVETADTSVSFNGLTASTDYTVKISAESAVGRSDRTVLDVKTSAKSSGSSGGSHSGGSSSSIGTTTKPSQPDNNGTTNGSSAAKYFIDIASSAWYADAVQYVTDKGLMNGTDDNQFSPSASTTRGMLMTVLARYAGEDTTGGAAWYEKGMEWAKAKGVSDGTNPNADITREQLVTMLYRYAGTPAANGSLSDFSDATSVSSYAVNAMQWAVANGIVNGSNSKLNPQNNATRAEVAAILMRFCKMSK